MLPYSPLPLNIHMLAYLLNFITEQGMTVLFAFRIDFPFILLGHYTNQSIIQSSFWPVNGNIEK